MDHNKIKNLKKSIVIDKKQSDELKENLYKKNIELMNNIDIEAIQKFIIENNCIDTSSI
jgi:hypothetical protein